MKDAGIILEVHSFKITESKYIKGYSKVLIINFCGLKNLYLIIIK